jgi:hypothetical protein
MPVQRNFKLLGKARLRSTVGPMNWQDQLITVYLYVSEHYRQTLWTYCQRMSPYADLSFSDEEVIALYLFGIIDKFRSLKQIYGYAVRHLLDWLPKLPCYVAFVQRLNKLPMCSCPYWP